MELKFYKSLLAALLFYGLIFLSPASFGDEIGFEKILITPEKVSKGARLTISKPKGPPSQLAVETPEGLWIYIVSVDDNFNYFTPSSFVDSQRLEIKVDQLKGITYDEKGNTKEHLVFEKRGRYRFYFASNLGTEPENTDAVSVYVEYSK